MLINSTQSHDDVLQSVYRELKRAGTDTDHAFRFFTFATAGSGHGDPRVRMVVLRSFEPDWHFEFYTDARSGKVEELRRHPVTESLFWNPSQRVQLRVSAASSVHHDDELSNKRWHHVQGDDQKAYASPVSPGQPIADPSDAHSWPEHMDARHFAVVRSRPYAIKVLQISGLKHLALEYSRNDETGEWMGSWIAP